MSARPLAASILIAAALWAGGAAQSAAAPPAWEKLGVQAYESPRTAPPFVLPALDGRTVRLEDTRGKAVLLFFWATW